MAEKKRSRIGRVTFRPEQLDLDLQDILKDFYLPEDVSLVLNIPLIWDASLKKWKIAAVGGATEETLAAIKAGIPKTTTAAGNLRVSVEESAIKQPVDVQDHWQENIVISPSSAKTASGNTTDIDVGRFIHGKFCLDVTAVSGTIPTLDVYIEGKYQLSGKYETIWSQTGITAVGTFFSPVISPLVFKFIRAKWTITGTSPSFTFSVEAEMKS